MSFLSTYIKDSKDFWEAQEVSGGLEGKNGLLQRNSRLITADTISMYNNIDTHQGLEALKKNLEDLKVENKLSKDFNLDMIICAATLSRFVMKWNIMEFDTYLSFQTADRQSNGNLGMQQLCEQIYLSVYTKNESFYPNAKSTCQYFWDASSWYFCLGSIGWRHLRSELIKTDHIWVRSEQIWLAEVEQWWTNFACDLLDLSVSFEHKRLVTITHQKPSKFCQYLSPNSAHPSLMAKDTVTSMLITYYCQNTYRKITGIL